MFLDEFIEQNSKIPLYIAVALSEEKIGQYNIDQLDKYKTI